MFMFSDHAAFSMTRHFFVYLWIGLLLALGKSGAVCLITNKLRGFGIIYRIKPFSCINALH